ncbi:MAG: putative Extracellular ligand-binding receptor [Nitrospira sp.]|jgi:ABC-type branched-subunit amino acid transport system substrate-binding protein|nr:putative Extracellular ligand-binding receptor [Nitrospira sp.]
MVLRSVSRPPYLRVCSVSFTVAFLAGLISFSEAAPTAKTPASPRTKESKSTTGAGQSILDQAKRLIDSEQPESAAVMLRRFIESSPAPDLLDDAYLLMAAAMFGMKEHPETIRYVKQLLGEFPTSELVDRAKLLLAKTHARAGNLDLALPLLSEIRSLSTDPSTKRDALRLMGEFQAQKKDFLRAIQAWLEEIPLDAEEQAGEAEGHIRELVNETLDVPALVRVRDAYPKTFPGDVASIKLIELRHAAGEDHLVERDIRLFLRRFPSHPYATKAADLQTVVRTKFKSHPYSIAAIFPMSGKLAAFGTEVLNGIQIALERSRDGADAPSIGLIVKDTENDRAAFLDELSDVLTDDHPLAVIGPLLSKNLPVMAEMAERTRIPLITPSATATNLRRLGNYVFSTALTYGQQAKRVADYAIHDQHYKRLAILYPDTVYGRELARLFEQEIRQQDGEIIASEAYKEGDADFRAMIARLKAEDLKKYGLEVPIENAPEKSASRQSGKKNKRILYSPGFDAVFIPGRSIDVGLLATQLAFHDVTVPLLGANGWNSPDFARVADRSTEGGVFVDGFFADANNPAVQDFVERYRKRFHSTPSLFAAQGYDAARLAVEAIRSGATTGEAIRDYLMMQHDLPALSGPSGFSAEGTLNRRVFLIQVRQGKFVPVD